ncbi:hypothetical protein ZWY2020_028309 [Hordeum vulgare]|nr:hypothetical protein ZWY2020_028309 [Hordeum vulgare]
MAPPSSSPSAAEPSRGSSAKAAPEADQEASGRDQEEAAVRALRRRVSCRRRGRLALPRPRHHWEELGPSGVARPPPTRRQIFNLAAPVAICHR